MAGKDRPFSHADLCELEDATNAALDMGLNAYLPAIAIAGALLRSGAISMREIFEEIDNIILRVAGCGDFSKKDASVGLRTLLEFRRALERMSWRSPDGAGPYQPLPEVSALIEELRLIPGPLGPHEDRR